MGIKKERVLVAYYIQTAFGVSNRTGAIIVETDAFQKDIPQGGDPAPLLTDLIAALENAGELRGVNLKRPRANYVEILSVAPVLAGSAIYSTRLQTWQDAQNVKK